jgi:hypothetical protein
MACIDHDHQSAQRHAPKQVGAEQLVPPAPDLGWDFGVSVARQIDQAILVPKGEEIDQLRAPRGAADECQLAPPADGVERTGFARVRATHECHLCAAVGRQLMQLGSARQVPDRPKRTHAGP